MFAYVSYRKWAIDISYYYTHLIMNQKVLEDLYAGYVGSQPQSLEELPSSGSNRRYFRLRGERDMIGVLGTCAEENDAFIYMSAHFRKQGIRTPEVVSVSDDRRISVIPFFLMPLRKAG